MKKNYLYIIFKIEIMLNVKGRFPFVSTGWSDWYIPEQDSVVNQICPVKSVNK